MQATELRFVYGVKARHILGSSYSFAAETLQEFRKQRGPSRTDVPGLEAIDINPFMANTFQFNVLESDDEEDIAKPTEVPACGKGDY